MKKIIFLTFVSLLCSWSFAQDIVARHNDKGMYVVHTVAPKETFYSLGRLYNIPPKDIAAFNSLQMESGLTIGQSVNVPLSATNFSQEKTSGYPVYYVVGEKEGLYRVSVNNNKVLMANLRKWNNLQSDAISAGQRLVVGYLLSSDPALANVNKTAAPQVKEVIETKAPEVKTEIAKKEQEEKPVQKAPPIVEKKQEQPKVTNVSLNDGNGGYFKNDFDAQTRGSSLRKDDMVTAGIFKTASGWQDAKYYALIDGVEPGTIIRIVNPNNNKAVYAKVLDKMTGIRQNQGYNVRISNAAATALDISETDKFFVRVNY
jgi:LysM repeat protein